MAKQFTSLIDLIGVIQSCKATLAHAQQVKTLVRSTRTPSSQDIMELSSLRRETTTLTRITKTFSNAAEEYIIMYILLLAGPGILVQKMLPYFTNKLRSITCNMLNNSSNNSNTLQEILEICYSQALHTSGTLHSNNYFIPLGKASLKWPYNPDFESKDYYKHKDCLAINNSYTKAFCIRFWVQALSECPNRPTLFYPPANHLPYYCLADVPRYLFRAFDQESSGRSDYNIIASAESISTTSWHSRINLLSRTGEEITRMLYNADNLIRYQHRCDPANIEICMINTRKFPRGFCLENSYYDNREYLLQGLLHHTRRSRMVLLAQLIQAGLYDLYPEFADPAASSSWTKHIRSLCLGWAVDMARACFKSFDTLDVALLLLLFKNRKLQALVTKENFPRVQECGRNSYDISPVEMLKNQDRLNALRWLTTDSQLLEGLFKCL
ncbi:uncharacterized protein BJX67DRAFT_374133 [Aspergillus lucknowensis]|uniref:Uncharacterized protein n=1 Tax=Aspergillus lucknowensis TaxID=176173 RepID=A0ABR4LL85_9EURO